MKSKFETLFNFNLQSGQKKTKILLVYTLLMTLGLSALFFGYCGFEAHCFSGGQLALFILPILFLLVLFFIACYNAKANSSFVFVLVAVPAAVSFGLFLLPNNVPDESAHIWQAAALFERSQTGFQVISAFKDGSFPASYSDYFHAMISATDWSDVFLCQRYLGYSSHLYLIPGLVLNLAKCLGFNAFIALSASRVLAGLFYCFAGYWIIKCAPSGKTAVMVFLLNPILLQQEASVSADSITNIVAIGYITLVIRIASGSIYTKKSLAVLFVSTILLLISKEMFFPLVLLNLIHWRKIKGDRSYCRFVVLCFSTIAMVGVLFIAFYRGSFMPDSFALMRAPLHCAKVFIKSIWEMGPFWFQSYAGLNLGALSINVWPFCFWLYIVVQSVVLFYNDENNKKLLCNTDRFVMIVVVFVNFFLIVMTMRNWTLNVDKREDIIMGIQGRYLIPLVLPLLLCILRPIKSNSEGHVLLYSSMLMCIILFVDFISIISAF